MADVSNIAHETLTFERKIKASAEDLFYAYADTRAREKWSSPSPETVFVVDETNFETGGNEIARCGTADALTWTMKVKYHLVVPSKLIAFTEELWDGDSMLTIALITFDIQSIGDSQCRLKLTDQITSFVGKGGIDGHRDGYPKSLDNLVASIERINREHRPEQKLYQQSVNFDLLIPDC